ncbi:cytochrome P450 1B1-like [Saccoglossus kowalevskii]|uniref:Cytochrome P450 1B1-like n=1 Tax=Saccoglossus kowalevskii TaxID=10224 RepID=A0ABM0GK99_SACKO|nr:PREDICTED: cytochrome P450 1B1-like [Saccoglossus kowalevskii]
MAMWMEITVSMSNLQCVLALITVLLVVILTRIMRTTSIRGMPGPIGWPVVGSLFSLGDLPCLTLTNMAKQYGDVFQIQLGNTNVVILNGAEAIREALFKKAAVFAGRPNFYTMMKNNGTGSDFAYSSYSEIWKKQKRMIESSLKIFVVDRQRELEDLVVMETTKMIRIVTEKNGKAVDMRQHIHNAVAKISCLVYYSKNYDYDNDDFTNLISCDEYFHDAIRSMGNPHDFLPVLRILPSRIQNRFDELVLFQKRFVSDIMAEHKEIESGIPRDIMDNMLLIRNTGDPSDAKKVWSHEHICNILCNMFGAGVFGISHAIYLLILHMIIYPEVQNKLLYDIDDVVSRKRLPQLSDRTKLPYSYAVVYEVMRVTSVSSPAVPHCTMDNTNIFGYDIPKGTPLIPNIWSANYDEAIWDEPHQFRPERFLSDDGSLNKKTVAQMMAFGVGKRRCPGEQMAVTLTHLIFVILLHQCRFDKIQGDIPQVKFRDGLQLREDPFRVIVTQR